MGRGRRDPIWYCCACNAGAGTSVLLHPQCLFCDHKQCTYCKVEKFSIHPLDSRLSKHFATNEAYTQPRDKQTELGRYFLPSFPSAPTKLDDETQLKDKQTDLDRVFLASSPVSSPQSVDFLVFRAISARLNYARNSSSSSLLSTYVDHKPAEIQEWLGSLEQHSDIKDSPDSRLTKFPDPSESPKVNIPAPASEGSEFVDYDSQQHAQYDTSSTSSISPGSHATAAGEFTTQSHPKWLIPLLDHPQYPIIVQAWSEFCSEDPVDQDGSIGNSHQSTSSSSGSASDNRSGKRPVQRSKRKRESDENDESGDAKKSKPSDLNNFITTEESKSFLACHFYKRNVRLHLKCMQKTFNNISALVQHLKKHHKLGPDHCVNCWTSFTGQAELQRHSLICKPTGGIPVDHLPNVEKTHQDAPQKWYWIWDQLFPNVPQPESPYTGTPEYILIEHFIDFFADRYAPVNIAQSGADQPRSSVTDHLRAAARDFTSIPAYMLNFRPLPTPPTTISEDETRASPVAPQVPLGDANISDECIAPSLLLGSSENLLRLGQQPMGSIEEAVDAPTGHTNTVHTTGSTMNDPRRRSGQIWNATTLEEMNTSARSSEVPFLVHPPGAMSPEPWDYASGMTEAEHILKLWEMDSENDSNVNLPRPGSWGKDWDEPMEQD